MQKGRNWRYLLFVPLVAFTVFAGAHATFAQTDPASENYQLVESEFGGGSSLESCSDQYCARVSIGDIADGAYSRSDGGGATFGPIVNTDPLLEVIIEPGISNLGVLSTQQTATKTMKVKVRSYLSGGYVLQIIGDPPKYEGHTLKTPTSLTGSAPGTEQFAINAAANTVPSVGADPVQVPSVETSFGEVDDQYNIPNLFKYVSGDTIGRSLTESGQTDYTITMIVNINSATPAGLYSSDFSAVVIPFY